MSLELEFRPLAPQPRGKGRRIADKLIKVFRKDSKDLRFLHLEIQAKRERDFRWRVHTYNLRAEYRYGQPVASFVLLLDDDLDWLPRGYRGEVYGSRRTLTFRTVKVARWRGREAELEEHANPVALFVLAHLEGRRLKNDEEARAEVKLRLYCRLRDRGMSVEEFGHWYHYLDWLLPLSEGYNLGLWEKFRSTQKEKVMPYVTFAERYGEAKGLEKGLEKGRREGLLKAIRLGLKLKFQQEGLALLPQIEALNDLPKLEAICDAIEPAASLDEVRKLLPVPGAEQG